MILSIPSPCEQGNGIVSNETKVKPLGVKGVKYLRDGGVVESYVSADKYADVLL